ncbi:hypothetical protein [Streptomyces sp. NPDC017524]|uniref:hypothetical protein n=1 Tax=unclassified Streptomyces TaxID=2593676 RepID=UPI0037B244F7
MTPALARSADAHVHRLAAESLLTAADQVPPDRRRTCRPSRMPFTPCARSPRTAVTCWHASE